MNAGFGARLPFFAAFFAGAFFAAFLAGAFLAAFFAGAFFAAFFAGAFLVAFFADDFFAGDFFAADFLDADFFALAITVSVKGVFFSSTLGDAFSPVKIKMSVLCLVRNIKIYCVALGVSLRCIPGVLA